MNVWRRVLGLGWPARRRLLAAVALGAGAAASAIGLAATSAWLIARAAERPPVLHLMVAVVAVRALGLGRGVLRYGERLAAHDAAFRVLGDVRTAAVRRLERLLPSARPELASGDVLARVVDDADSVLDAWVRVLLPVAVGVLAATGALVLVVVVYAPAGVVLALSIVVAVVLGPWVARRASGRAPATLAQVRGDYEAAVIDVLEGAEELEVLGVARGRVADLDAIDERQRHATRGVARAAGLAASVTAWCAGAAVWGSLALAGRAVDGRALAPVLVALVVLTPLAVHEVVAGVVVGRREAPRLAASAERLFALLDGPDAVVSPPSPVQVPDGPYGITLDGVVARWRPDGPAVLEGVSWSVPAGAHVAVVGPSGVGKSTLAALLVRFLDPVRGTVWLDTPTGRVRAADLDDDDVRRVVGWCAQDAHVFDTTLAANVRLARPDATDDELRAVADVVGLTPWLSSLPDGWDTFVGEHGRALSGGQQQRLALARSVLADHPVVVLDEPTEHLPDDLAAAVVRRTLDALVGRTVIVITHRPDLLAPMDATYELRAGVLSSEGTGERGPLANCSAQAR